MTRLIVIFIGIIVFVFSFIMKIHFTGTDDVGVILGTGGMIAGIVVIASVIGATRESDG